MIRNIYIAGILKRIVFVSILIVACKARKPASPERGFEALDTKFERLYIEACTQNMAGNYSTALSQFTKCSEIKPGEASVYFQIGKIKQQLVEESSAFQNAAKANSLAPDNKFYAVFYASLLKDNGDYKKSAEVLEASIITNPKDMNLYKELDAVYELQNKTDERIGLWNRFIKNAGLKTSTGLKLVALYKSKKDFESAHAMYNELKRAAPNKTLFYLEDARLYELQQDTVNAKRNYESALESDPLNWEANYALFQFYERKMDDVNAERYFRNAFEKSPVGLDTKVQACQQLLKTDKPGSKDCFLFKIAADALVNYNGFDAKALFTAAELQAKCGDCGSAAVNYQSASRIDPNLFDAWMGAMNCLIDLKQYKQSVMIGEKAIEYFPFTASVFECLARSYNLDGDYVKAYNCAVNGEKLAFDDTLKSAFCLQMGISLCSQGKYNDALNIIEKGITINRDDAELLDQQGNIFYYLNETGKAVECWKRAKSLGVQNDLIDKKISEGKVY